MRIYRSPAGALALALGVIGSVGGFWIVMLPLLALGSPALDVWSGRALAALALAPLSCFALALAMRPMWFATSWWIDGDQLHFHVPGRSGGLARAVAVHGFVSLIRGRWRTRAVRGDGTALSIPTILRAPDGTAAFRIERGALVIAREDSRPG